MGGVVIGSIQDLSAGFYNPGSLALVTSSRFVLSAKVLQVESIVIEAPQGHQKRETTVGVPPSFFALMLTADPKKPNQFGGIYMARQAFKGRISSALVEDRNVLPNVPGTEILSASVLFDEDLNETWGGLMWSRRMSENLGIGATWFVAYRGQRIREELVAQALTTAGDVASSDVIRDFHYHNYRTLLKLGVAHKSKPLTWGFSLTTPSLNVLGNGTSYIDLAQSGMDVDGDSINDDYFASNLQKDKKTKYPTSWAIGAGAAYELDQTEVTVAAEWYGAVDQFHVIETTDFQAQTTGQTLPNDVTQQLKEVFNWGVAARHEFNERFSGYGAFTTDYSAVVPEGSNSVVTKWDLYHVTAGAEFTVRRFGFTAGIEWSFGSENVPGLDLSAVEGSGGLRDAGDAKVSYDNLTFIIGFSIGGKEIGG